MIDLLFSPSARALGSQHGGQEPCASLGAGRTGLQASLAGGTWRDRAEILQGKAFSVRDTDVCNFL